MNRKVYIVTGANGHLASTMDIKDSVRDTILYLKGETVDSARFI